MKHLTTLIATLLLPFGAMSQSIHIDSDNGLIKACPEDVLTLTATVNSPVEDEANDVSYLWDFDNGDRRTTRVPSVEYAYKTGGAYMLSVTRMQDGNTATDIAKVIVGKSPDFSGYKNDINGSYSGVCLGEKITLTMPISDRTVKYNSRNYYYESAPQSLYGSFWSEKVKFKSFAGATLGAGDISAVKLSFFHDNTANVQITLTAPDGKQAVLSPYDKALDGGSEITFANKKLMEYTFTLANTSEFTNLVGAPINGDWKLEITTNDTENSCYVYGFEIVLDDNLVANHQWQFDAKYDLRRAVWSGKGVSATSAGIADARPQEEGTTRYSFVVSDDMGCMHDTSVFVNVELASFTSVDEGGTAFIGEEINFNNHTSWAAETTWHFGDNSPREYTANAPHAYYERGKYEVIMETKSAKGCTDVDTQYVSVIPRPLEIKEVNIFTKKII